MTTGKTKEMNYYLAQRIREVCIENNWFTAGDNEAYSNLLNNVLDGSFNVNDIAEDIYIHSSTNDLFEKVLNTVKNIADFAYEVFEKSEDEIDEEPSI